MKAVEFADRCGMCKYLWMCIIKSKTMFFFPYLLPWLQMWTCHKICIFCCSFTPFLSKVFVTEKFLASLIVVLLSELYSAFKVLFSNYFFLFTLSCMNILDIFTVNIYCHIALYHFDHIWDIAVVMCTFIFLHEIPSLSNTRIYITSENWTFWNVSFSFGV